MLVWMHVCIFMNECMHVCICMYVCMYVSLYICMHVCMYACYAVGGAGEPSGPAVDVSSLLAEERERMECEKEEQMRVIREQLAENERLLKEQSVRALPSPSPSPPRSRMFFVVLLPEIMGGAFD
jgi:hypothetical protein